MGEKQDITRDFVHLARLAANEQWDDVRLFLARLVRSYRMSNPELAEQLNEFLKGNPARRGAGMRDAGTLQGSGNGLHLPTDRDSQLTLLNRYDGMAVEEPLLGEVARRAVEQLILERKKQQSLLDAGLTATRSAIFEGPPGVGKTLTAKWIAGQLGKPLLVLDLATVMSSFLGRTGSNLRSAIEYAKRSDAILLLDEIDSIAKRRSDDADVGELKRLVTVVLQEVDAWPEDNLLLAATNHPELIDPALWRRFDAVVHFGLPDKDALRVALVRFLGPDYDLFKPWIESLVTVMFGMSFSDIEKVIQRFRRSVALELVTPEHLVSAYLVAAVSRLERKDKLQLALDLARNSELSQHKVSELTHVARDTIRKHLTKGEARNDVRR